MTEFEETNLNEFGSKYLVKAIKNSSEGTQREIAQELRKMADQIKKVIDT
jgi:hypothetical protein